MLKVKFWMLGRWRLDCKVKFSVYMYLDKQEDYDDL